LTIPLLELAARAETLARSRRVRAVLLLLLAIYAVRHVSRSMGDFKVYQRAAKRAVAGEAIYRLEDPHRYLYAPVVTFLFLPLAVLPTVVGRILWFSLNVVLVVSIFRSTAKLLFREGRAPPGFFALVLLLSFRFIDNNLGHGQLNILLLWLVLRAYVEASRARYGWAGVALAAAIAAKIVPVIFLLQIVLRRQWRFAAWTVVGLIALTAIPIVWWGSDYPQVLRDWTAVVADQAGHYEMGNKINQSISAFTYRLFRPYPDGRPFVVLPESLVDALTIAVHAAFLLPLVWLSWRLAVARSEEPAGPEELALYLLYSTVAAPYSWKYYFANLVFPFGVAVARLATGDRRLMENGLYVAFALNLLAGLEILGKRLSTLFQLCSFHFLAVALLFALIARVAFRESRAATFPSSGALC
jgi:alpha-1,2-mannosyltransferase